MVATDAFSQFGRRIASTQGCPYVVIAETPNPIQDLAPEELHKRAAAMLETVIAGLTLPVHEIERRAKDAAQKSKSAPGAVRPAVPM